MRPFAPATITVAGCRGFTVGTKAALRSRSRTSRAAWPAVATGLMAKAGPAAAARRARNGAVCAGGPTTPTSMPFGCGLW